MFPSRNFTQYGVDRTKKLAAMPKICIESRVHGIIKVAFFTIIVKFFFASYAGTYKIILANKQKHEVHAVEEYFICGR